ncbi:cell Wall and Capsule [Methylobacterium phyllosphaerae]|uniref:Cell Wall and Capsule n=1 Tax=Methylobacterium phyllosphaerae TaxID=418223 RepID=A0AAE8HNI2_9HYPH|nr:MULTISPECIES: ComEC/Rec2 family competence protein [Methylobacterium]APT30914.1 cell Wall and Capsule [Methylobacterium phyllosphaerae]SFG34575.1 competence protein ComEC [Methylobacterium phyllosphaerae]SFV01873.1 competence protein ComEC [Methylobacterium sp. UNCCL125]
MRRIGARLAGGAVALAGPRAPALPVIRHWVAEGLARDAEQRRLFPWLAVAFGGGILVYFAATDGAPSLAAPLVAAALALAPIPLLGARPAALAAVLAVAAAFLGFAAAAWRVSEVAAPVLNRTTIGPLIGTVEALDEREVGARLLIRVESFAGLAPEARPARVRVSFRKTPTPLPGDVVAATARLLPPPEAARPGGYDFARDAYFQGIGAVGSLVGAVTIRAPTEPPPLRLRLAATLDAARNGLTRRIAEAAGGQAGAVAAALVTGKRGLIGPATNDALRAAGIYHVVSISGLHMVLAAGVVFWLVRALLALVPHCALLWPIKKIAAGFAMVGVTAYCAFSGWDIAAERSLIMTLIMLGAILVDRPALSMRNLALAALIALAREPEGLLGPSFQMSFGAVAGLIACARLIDGRLFVRPGAGRLGRLVGTGLSAVTGTLATTLVAQVATAPFATYHFQTIQPFGLVGNALTLPLVSLVVMPSAVIGILAYPFALDRPIWWLMGQAVGGMLAVSQWIAGFERAIVVVPAFGTAALFLLTAGLLLATLPASRLRWLAVPPILLGLVVAARPDRYDLYVDRQGAGAAVRGPDGRLAALGSPSGFVLEQWLKADGDGRGAGGLIVRSGGGRCDRLGCTARLPDGRAVALVRDRRAFPEDCARAAVLITGLVAPPTCTSPLVIDRRVLSAQGAVALRSEGESFVAHHARADGRAVPWRPRSGHGSVPPQPVTAPSAEARASDDGATTPPETDASGGDLAPGDAPAEPLQ